MSGLIRNFETFYNLWKDRTYSTGQCAPGAANWVKAFTGIEPSGNGKAYCEDGQGEVPALAYFASKRCPSADRGHYLTKSEIGDEGKNLINGDIAGWGPTDTNPYGHVAMWHNTGWWGQNQGPEAGPNGTSYRQPHDGYAVYGIPKSIFRFNKLGSPSLKLDIINPFEGLTEE